jgi:hypothetical protein
MTDITQASQYGLISQQTPASSLIPGPAVPDISWVMTGVDAGTVSQGAVNQATQTAIQAKRTGTLFAFPIVQKELSRLANEFATDPRKWVIGYEDALQLSLLLRSSYSLALVRFWYQLSRPMWLSCATKRQPTADPTARQLGQLRDSLGTTWSRLAVILGVSRRTVHSWVRGSRVSAGNRAGLERTIEAVQTAQGSWPQWQFGLWLTTGRPSPLQELSRGSVSTFMEMATAARESGAPIGHGDDRALIVPSESVGIARETNALGASELDWDY